MARYRRYRVDGWAVAGVVVTAMLAAAFWLSLCEAAFGSEAPAGTEGSDGVTAWALVGANPEFGKSQELRLGYEGLLFPELELAVGAVHLDAPEPAVDAWSARGYLLVHALDASMVASVLGNGVTLPDGNLYGGLFAQYSFDRADEWSGGYLVGGLVDWPRGWQTVAEYTTNLWNNDHNAYAFAVGLRKKF
jgi:hypothetical protein